ncbi:MAG: archaemetzincin [Spirochaetota bacterium]
MGFFSKYRSVNPIGSLTDLPPGLRRAFEPGDDFKPVPEPGPHDWLSHHKEPGQTYDEYIKSSPLKPSGMRKILYLQPIGVFTGRQSPSLGTLKTFASKFFALEVRLLTAISMSGHSITTRINRYTGKRQLLTGDILDLLRKMLPVDAFCILAITMEDLYPHPSWNFVFGQASLDERVGVFSFARYDPAFYGNGRTPDFEELLLLRSCKVLAHETSHMFGLYHCIYYHCLMNGSNHLGESDARPIHLCPVCLRKLYYSIGFDALDRYRGLAEFYEKVGFEEEARWVFNRILCISKKS